MKENEICSHNAWEWNRESVNLEQICGVCGCVMKLDSVHNTEEE